MSYEKHNFKSGDKLYAAQLNEMDEQIDVLSETPIVKTINNIGPDEQGNIEVKISSNEFEYLEVSRGTSLDLSSYNKNEFVIYASFSYLNPELECEVIADYDDGTTNSYNIITFPIRPSGFASVQSSIHIITGNFILVDCKFGSSISKANISAQSNTITYNRNKIKLKTLTFNNTGNVTFRVMAR